MILTQLNVLLSRNKPATHSVLDKTVEKFRVWPQYIDFNLHINNANYLVFAERTRWLYFKRTGTMKTVMDNKYNFIVASTEVSYIRELRIMQTFTVETQVIGTDEKYLYIEHLFKRGEKLHAHILVKAAITRGGKVVPTAELSTTMGLDDSGLQRPEVINGWRNLANIKRASLES